MLIWAIRIKSGKVKELVGVDKLFWRRYFVTMGCSKKLYNVLGGYKCYYIHFLPKVFTKLHFFEILLCVFFTNTYAKCAFWIKMPGGALLISR